MGQQKDRRHLGELRRLHVEATDVDPALGPQGADADDPHSDQAGHREPVDGPGPAGDPLHRHPGQQQGQHHAHGSGDPVLVPVGVAGLPLGAGDQEAGDEDHRQGDPPEQLVDPGEPAAAPDRPPAGEQTGAAPAPGSDQRHAAATSGSRAARSRKAAAVADWGAESTAGRPPSPPSTTASSIGSWASRGT